MLPLVLVAAVAALFLQHGLNSLRLLLNNTFEQKVIFDLRSDLYSHIQLLPLRWFDNRATGDLMTRILEDVTSVERVLIDGIEQGTVAVLQIIIVLAGNVLSEPKTHTRRTGSGAVSGRRRICGTRSPPIGVIDCNAALRPTMNSLLHDNLSGIRQIKSFVREGEEHTPFQQSERRITARHSRGDASLGNLQPVDVFVRFARRLC